MSGEENKEIQRAEGGKKVICVGENQILREVWKVRGADEYLICYQNDMHKVKKEVVNNTEVYTLVKD
ncbi:hypothetical protein EUAN_12190 [Andreesenia angusta]|uniref:Uncharacterized protein n=1 Tax=Andreesenia angusta TaxID=39480 RepID=A0A1S1V6W2_9FIRM|nr:hypothetical protein [Andreesenia angusta]OHW62150.1 hypothetical protein EUAN_12190 [Andreesenia angusta]